MSSIAYFKDEELTFVRGWRILNFVAAHELQNHFKTVWDLKHPQDTWNDDNKSGKKFYDDYLKNKGQYNKAKDGDIKRGRRRHWDMTTIVRVYSTYDFMNAVNPDYLVNVRIITHIRNDYSHFIGMTRTDAEFQSDCEKIRKVFINLGLNETKLDDAIKTELRTADMRHCLDDINEQMMKLHPESMEEIKRVMDAKFKGFDEMLLSLKTGMTNKLENVEHNIIAKLTEKIDTLNLSGCEGEHAKEKTVIYDRKGNVDADTKGSQSTPTTPSNDGKLQDQASVQTAAPKLRRISGKKKAVTVEMMERVYDERMRDPSIKDLRDVSMLLLAFAGPLMSTDLINILRSDVIFTDTGLKVFIEQSKDDTKRSGFCLNIYKTSSKLCPVRCLEKYLRYARMCFDSTEFVFRAVSSNGHALSKGNMPMSSERVHALFRDALKPFVDTKEYNLFCLRGVEEASPVNSVVPARMIKRDGKWVIQKEEGNN